MKHKHSHAYPTVFGWVLLLLAIPAWWWWLQPLQSVVLEPGLFMLLHGTMEFFAVVLAALVFVTGYRAMLSERRAAVVLLGVAFLGVALLDLLHITSYYSTSSLTLVNTTQKSTFFWLCARLLAAVTLLVYALLPVASVVGKMRQRAAVGVVVGAVGALGLLGLVWPPGMPALFSAAHGFTALTVTLESCFITINLATLVVLWARHRMLTDDGLVGLGFAVSLLVVSECFTVLGNGGTNITNIASHFYRVVAYLYLFQAAFSQAMIRPWQRLNRQHLREEQVLNAAPDGILLVSQTGQILLVNPAMEKLSGYAAKELLGKNVDIFLPPHLRQRHAASVRGFFTPGARSMKGLELSLVRRDGETVPVSIALGLWVGEQENNAIAYIHDLRERKGFEASLRHRAAHDQLTGLPNRWLFNLQLNEALAQARRDDRYVAVLMLDLDDFKTVNDSFGHATGDTLLVQVASRLRATLRENDTLARFGGDEFAILIGDMQSTEEAIAFAEKLIAMMEETYLLHNQEVHASGSIGLAFYPADAQDSEDLIAFADMAMYQAKRSARAIYACYSPNLGQHARENMQIHVRLKEALDRGHLQLFYQPKIDIDGKTIVGAEALLRWHDLVLGAVSPARFIPVAESSGLILPISAWVLDTACQQIAAWQQNGTPLRVAVNFSAQQFRHGNLVDKVRQALRRSGAPAYLLEVEITESVAMERPEAARDQLGALVALGCKVALDDFGTGYSSLAYLKALPVSVLKIDRAFIKDLPHDQSDAKICRAIIALAHGLDMTLVAEGVETDNQLLFLRSHGCETCQGWLFAKAMSAADLTARLNQQCHSLLAQADELAR